MKRSLFWVLMGAPMLTFAQINYTVQLKVNHLDVPEKAYLSYQDAGKLITDSASLTSGTYNFKGTVKEPVLAQISIRKSGAMAKTKALFNTAVWLEKGALKIIAEDPLSKPVITGGQLNADYEALYASKEADRIQMAAASKRYMESTDEQKKAPDFMKNHMKVMKAAMGKSAERDSLYISTHPNSYLSLYLISNTTSTAPVSELEPRYKALSKSLQTSMLGKELLAIINGLKNRDIGGKAPDFTLNDAANKPVSLSSFRGKYVLVDFWASWCVPCRKENPNVKAAYETLKNKNFTVLSVSLDDGTTGEAKWLAAIEKDQLEWTQVRDVNRVGGRVTDLYGVKTIPQNFLIDPSGKIIAKGLRGAELEATLAKLMKEKKRPGRGA